MAGPSAESVWAVVGRDTELPYIWTASFSRYSTIVKFIQHHYAGRDLRRVNFEEEWRKHEDTGLRVQKFRLVPIKEE